MSYLLSLMLTLFYTWEALLIALQSYWHTLTKWANVALPQGKVLL